MSSFSTHFNKVWLLDTEMRNVPITEVNLCVSAKNYTIIIGWNACILSNDQINAIDHFAWQHYIRRVM